MSISSLLLTGLASVALLVFVSDTHAWVVDRVEIRLEGRLVINLRTANLSH